MEQNNLEEIVENVVTSEQEITSIENEAIQNKNGLFPGEIRESTPIELTIENKSVLNLGIAKWVSAMLVMIGVISGIICLIRGIRKSKVKTIIAGALFIIVPIIVYIITVIVSINEL